jgi:hypothetical protein
MTPASTTVDAELTVEKGARATAELQDALACPARVGKGGAGREPGLEQAQAGAGAHQGLELEERGGR